MVARGASRTGGRERKNKRSKPSKLEAARRAQKERQALESLDQKRRPFEPLLKEIVEAVLHAEAPKLGSSQPLRPGLAEAQETRSWVEVGCGLGQLRNLLPLELLSRTTHTDVSNALVQRLLETYPAAHAVAANVTQLPFETASVDAVLGLCVFDSFPNPEQACREIRRVLREQGYFIHFLDAATNIEPILVELVSQGRLPLPNFLADTAVRRPELLDMPQVEHLIPPYHDVLSVPFSHFSAITEILQRTGHPLADMLCVYKAVFEKQPFEALPAARAFVRLTSDPATGRPINQALTSLFSTLQQAPYSDYMPFDLQSHSSLAGFKEKLEHHFGTDFGYELQLSEVVYARAYEADQEQPLRAQIRRVGIGQNCMDWPAPEGVPTSQLKPGLQRPEQAGATPQSHILREAAVYCLVSRKNSGPPPARNTATQERPRRRIPG